MSATECKDSNLSRQRPENGDMVTVSARRSHEGNSATREETIRSVRAHAFSFNKNRMTCSCMARTQYRCGQRSSGTIGAIVG